MVNKPFLTNFAVKRENNNKENDYYYDYELDINIFKNETNDERNFCSTQTFTEVINEKPDKDVIMKHLKKVKKEYKTQKKEEISFNKSVSEYTKYAKPTKEYVKHGNLVIKKGTPIHVRASMNYNFMVEKFNLPYMQVNNGMKLKYVYVNPKNLLGTNVIAFIGNWPKEFDKYFTIDYKLQFEKSFLKAIQNIYNVMNWGDINFKAGGLNKFMKKRK